MSHSANGESQSNLGALVVYLSPHVGRLSIGFISILVGSFLAVQIPKLVHRAIDALEPIPRNPHAVDGVSGIVAGVSPEVTSAFWGIVLLAIGSAVALFFSRYCVISVSRLAEQGLRNTFYKHLQSLPVRYYHSTPTGDLMTRSGSDIEQVRMLLGPGIMYPLQCIVLASLAISHMAYRNWVLTVAVLAPVAGLSIWVNVHTRRLHRLWTVAQQIYSDLSAHVQENLSGIRVIKAYCQEDAETDRFEKINRRYFKQNVALIRLRGRLWPFMRYISGVGLAIILCFGGWMVTTGWMTLGGLAEFIQYFFMLFWPIVGFGWVLNVIHRGAASWVRIREVLCVVPESVSTPVRQEPDRLSGQIEIRHLNFRYDGRAPLVLKDLSLFIPAGSTLAIVGPTGVGKSTLVHLLLRLYPTPPGTIFLDGTDINEIRLDILRKNIAFVSQEAFLFSERLRANILFGVSPEEADADRRMCESARKACLEAEIKQFPDAYDTLLGERGLTLSGGQRQRVGIARALILERPILILDDALSSVDTQTEEFILRSIEEDMKQRTTILISHRISTVRNADHIIVLSGGSIVEQGSHEDLVKRGELYADIFRRQQLEESLGIRR